MATMKPNEENQEVEAILSELFSLTLSLEVELECLVVSEEK